jgi:hypothetical protein
MYGATVKNVYDYLENKYTHTTAIPAEGKV